jgi:hypothetical protein
MFNKTITKTLVLAVAVGIFACDSKQEVEQIEQQVTDRDIIAGKYIVTFHEADMPSSRKEEPLFTDRAQKMEYSARVSGETSKKIQGFLRERNIDMDNVDHVYANAFSGFAGSLSEAEVNALRNDPRVASVEPDRMVYLDQHVVEKVEGANLNQTTTCAVNNAGGAGTGNTSRWIWVVDSGIDLTHPDLNVVTNTSYARSFVGGTANDCNGHGTHVAGIAAARNNTIGVVGVSAGAPVVPVRVFGCTGGSATSTILSGINHVAANDLAGDVMNLSLGGYFGNNCDATSSYRSAVLSVANGGTHVAIAAGNSSANAALYQPACINGTRIYTVASMTCAKGFSSSFSNFGRPPIDWIATGSSVYSTYLNGGYATLSGTSMAAPVVAGVLHQRNGAPRNCGTVTYGGVSYPIACR